MFSQALLSEFNYLGDVAYMDVSTMGVQPACTLAVCSDHQHEAVSRLLGARRLLGGGGGGGGQDASSAARRNIAQLIHAPAEDVFFTQNTTQGNNLLPGGYPFEQGDEVIVSQGDFPSLILPWVGAQARGLKLIAMPCDNGVVSADDFLQRITPRTRVIALSFVQSASGYKADLAKLGAVCREKGILLMVDAVQGLGRCVIDVEGMGIDVLASASYKSMLGVMGAGVCYCRKEVMQRITPPIYSGNTQCGDIFSHTGAQYPVYPFRDRAQRMESGTSNNYGIAAMGCSAQYLLSAGVPAIEQHVHALEGTLRAGLSRFAVQMQGSDQPDTWSGTVSLTMPDAAVGALRGALEEARIRVALRDSGYMRVGLHLYNTHEHIERLLNVLGDVPALRD